MKKSTIKITTSPAPATKTAKAVATKKTAPAVLTAPRAAVPRAATVTPVKPVPPKPAVVPVAVVATPKTVAAPKPVVTSIIARIDVGFGNALYVRGDGPGLSWDKGALMDCIGNDEWVLALGESARPFTVKLLVNDITWSSGPDYTVPSGSRVTLAPQF